MTLDELEQFLNQYPRLTINNAVALNLVEMLRNSRCLIEGMLHGHCVNDDARRFLEKLTIDLQAEREVV